MNQPTARASKDILGALVLLLLWPGAATFLAGGNFTPAHAVTPKTSLKAIEIPCAPSAAVAKGAATVVLATSTGHSPARDHLQLASLAN